MDELHNMISCQGDNWTTGEISSYLWRECYLVCWGAGITREYAGPREYDPRLSLELDKGAKPCPYISQTLATGQTDDEAVSALSKIYKSNIN